MKTLGKALKPKDIASKLDVDVRLVRKYYHQLGGVRLGPRTIRFFEKEVENAIQAQRRQSTETVVSPDYDQRQAEKKELCHQKGCNKLGGESKEESCLVDEHGVFG